MELVGTARTNAPAVHRCGSRCALPHVWSSNGGVKTSNSFAQQFLVRCAHSCIWRIRMKGNPDMSRGLDLTGGDTPLAITVDRAALPGTAGDGWRDVAGRAVRAGDSETAIALARITAPTQKEQRAAFAVPANPSSEAIVRRRHAHLQAALDNAPHSWQVRTQFCLWLPDEGCHTGTPSLPRRFHLFSPSKSHYNETLSRRRFG